MEQDDYDDDAKRTMTVTTVTYSTVSSSPAPSSPTFQFQPSKEMFTDDESLASNSITFLTGRMPKLMSLSCDVDTMSPYQALLRKQIEIFEADCQEAQVSIQGRNKPILVGQVGIRCCHCAHVHPMHRTRAAVYFPTKLEGIYQAGQNMSLHMLQYCPNIPSHVRELLTKYKQEATATSNSTATTSHAGGGKKHWAHTAQVLGVYEDKRNEILRFECLVPDPVSLHHPVQDFEPPEKMET